LKKNQSRYISIIKGSIYGSDYPTAGGDFDRLQTTVKTTVGNTIARFYSSVISHEFDRDKTQRSCALLEIGCWDIQLTRRESEFKKLLHISTLLPYHIV
jgi:hypothetical protein